MDVEKRPAIYLSDNDYTIGQRAHLLRLEKALKALKYLNVILPLREAVPLSDGKGGFDHGALTPVLAMLCSNPANVFVGCLDYAGEQSDTARDYRLAIQHTGRAVIYSTDYRLSGEGEMGRNTLFSFQRTLYAYHPAYIVELDRSNQFYADLAQKIDAKIRLLGL